MAVSRTADFLRIALVLPTEYAYARGVLRGIIAATRERNLYAGGDERRRAHARRGARSPGTAAPALPWLFNVFRGVHGHSGRFLSKWFRDWNPDGIIGQIYGRPLASAYRDTGKPVVELFMSRRQSDFPRVLPDDVATGAMAARHFLDRGFVHFAYYGAQGMLWAVEREAGFRAEIDRAFRERRGGQHTASANDPAFTFSSFFARDADPLPAKRARSPRRLTARRELSFAMGNWLRTLPKPVAIFAANDLWGSELTQVAREQQIRVPDEIAVLGVDNEELLCELTHPPLSSIRIGGEQIGRAAVALLERMMLHGETPQQADIPRIAPVGVVTRQSTDVLAVEDPDVAAALRYIRRHAGEGLSVKQLLEAVPLNRRTLERRFVSVLGHTPLEEIHRVRQDRSRLLLQAGLAVHEVAARTGYRTPEYFATSFQRSTGMSPTEYRRQFAPRDVPWDPLPEVAAD